MTFSVVYQLNGQQIDQLVALYAHEFWCNRRKRADVERMLRNSDVIVGAVGPAGDLVGFVRVLTDYVYKATIFDLIVHKDWRGCNIGRLLMDTITPHPDIDAVGLPEMYRFYEKWGFTADVGPLGFMRRFNGGDGGK